MKLTDIFLQNSVPLFPSLFKKYPRGFTAHHCAKILYMLYISSLISQEENVNVVSMVARRFLLEGAKSSGNDDISIPKLEGVCQEICLLT